MNRGDTVILAAGDFPRSGGEARRLLESARRVICCDGAADMYRRRMRKDPDFVVGDGDSCRGRFANFIRIAEQDTNDLAKAIRFCRSRGWRKPILLGATGKRDDHALGNVFRALSEGLEVVTDFGRFVPFCGRRTFRGEVGAPVSVFATDSATRMTSRGLEWPLDGVRFRNFHCATLNRMTAKRLVLTSTHPVWLYFPF